ncbi:MAG: shikimate kinase [Myxococcota bacterium]
MSVPSDERARALVAQVLAAIDPRVNVELEPHLATLPVDRHIVLCGHRAAGKSRLLPLVGELTGRRTFDLDAQMERREGRAIFDWLRQDPAGFRSAERRVFEALPLPGAVVAVGGGFLAHHADLLARHLPVLVPISFETYRERLQTDSSRPRLRPDLDLDAELRETFRAREAIHSALPTVSLGAFLAHWRSP